MTTGIFTAMCLSLVLSQTPDDVYHTNRRNHDIPVNVDDAARAGFREFILYASSDQGRTWNQAGVIPASKKSFAYYAPGDGAYWFQVATVTTSGVQSPDDQTIIKSAPHLKMQIDTLKPIVKRFQAQRVGDEVGILFEVQEDHPEASRDGMRLEYSIKDALIETWKEIPMQPGLRGQVSFTPGHKQPLMLRLSVRDRAGNQSYGMAEVAGTVAAAGFQTPAEVPNNPPMFPGGLTIPKHPVEDAKPMPIEVKRPILPPPPGMLTGDPKPLVTPPGGLVMPPPAKEPMTDKVVADSRTPPEVPKTPPMLPGGIQPPGEGIQEIKPLAHATPAKKPLPLLQYVNQHFVKLQYEIKRQGPSGIGGIQIWLTKDDGDTWSPYAEVKDLANEAVQGRQERDFEFRDKHDAPFPDGVYGLILVVKNRAGLGREPRPGDAPEMRLEIDTKPPVAQLFKPAADPQHPNQLLLKWSAQDRNLADTPIDLEYADKRDGPWQPIERNLKNAGRFTNQLVTGDYSWKIPAGTPVQVYLRLRVRDRAGNESVAVTAEPQFVDLVEPEGSLIGVVTQPKR